MTASIELHNRSKHPREAWWDVTVPHAHAYDLGPICAFEDGGKQTLACKAETVGHVGARYLVRRAVPGLSVVRGTILPLTDADDPEVGDIARRLDPARQEGFVPSSWVTDELGALTLHVDAVVDGVVQAFALPVEQLVEGDAAEQRWRAWRRVGSLVWTVDYLVRSLDDVVELEGLSVQSNPDVGAPTVHVERLTISAGEVLVLDHRIKNGFGEPYAYPDPDHAGRVRYAVDLVRAPEGQPLPIGDGQGFEFYGALLCTPNQRDLADLVRDPSDEIHERLQSLYARADGGRAIGISTQWDGEYPPFDYLPQPHSNDLPELVRRARAEMATPGWLFADRPLGLGRYTGQTGSQDDFGAVKSTELLVERQLLLLDYLRWNVEEIVRPIHNRERDGSLLQLEAHPDWWTHSQRTHWSRSQSPDRLGKDGAGDTNGWHGKDGQHHSVNHTFSVFTVIPTMPVRQALEDEVLAAARDSVLNPRSSDGIGGTRALGRRVHGQVLRFFALGSELSWSTVVRECVNAWEKALGSRLDPAMPVRVVQADLDGDPRKLDGHSPYWTVWEHGLCLLGLAAAHAALQYRRGFPGRFDPIPGEERIEDLCEMVLSTLVRGAFYPYGGVWHTWQDLRYRTDTEGARLPERTLLEGGEADTHGRVGPTSNWADWIVPGMIYFARHPIGVRFANSRLDVNTRDQLQSIVAQWQAVELRKGRVSREWRATAPWIADPY